MTRLLSVRPHVLFLVGLLASQGQSTRAEIIPADRRIDWVLGQTVGVPGGIPNRTTIFTTLNAGATADQINNAISTCPSNQVVKLGPGTFNLSTTISFGSHNGVTLRGSGASTILKPSHNSEIVIFGSDPGYSAGTAITAGYVKGASNLTVASTSGLSVGSVVKIDQILDPNIMWSSDGAVRAVKQQAIIKAIAGNVVTVWPPLHYGLTPANSPLLHTISPQPIRMSGVEDLVIDGTGHTTVWGVLMNNTLGCWLKNVQTIKINNYHVYTLNTLFNEFVKVFINDSPDYLPNHGGILLGNGSDVAATGTAIYDCIFNKILPGVEVNGGSSGCIIAYNYFRDPRYSTTAQSVGINMNHGPVNIMNLYEGNIANMIMSDGYFGGSVSDTIFRNWSTGWTETFGNLNSRPLYLTKWSINENVVGNVFGITNFVPDQLYLTGNGVGYETSAIYAFGYPQGGNGDYTGIRPPSTDKINAYDMAVTNTMILHGNWESKTKTVTWAPGISDRSIPNSLYLTAKPAWFGNLTWPPFDPAKGYTNLNFASIPAGYRYINGIDPPGGGSGNQAPIAAASASPTSGGPPLLVTFSSAGSSDPEGTPLTYSWNFGDGSAVSTAANPSHSYAVDGAYVARLTVSDGTNSTLSSPIDITVTTAPPAPPSNLRVTAVQ